MAVSTHTSHVSTSEVRLLTERLCRFFITLVPECTHLSGKHTVFGKVISGEDVLQRIANVDVDKDDRPLEPVLISRCGELEKRKKKAEPQAQTTAQSQSGDRGRRRRSNEDVEMENSPEPRPTYKHRRQSDNLVDEGLRGRPRQRSGSRSPSRPLSTQGEESSDQSSPAKIHKRKRSASPSRHADGTVRRRRSLPNQYRDERFNKTYEDEDRYRPSPRRDDYRHPARRREDEEQSRRQDDRYRPSRERNRYSGDDGRLGDGRLGGSGYDNHDPPVKFKGRGVMKYREPNQGW